MLVCGNIYGATRAEALASPPARRGRAATRAKFDPVNVAVSAAGSLLVTDNGIRAVAP
jgi:hypothetical protein